MNRLIPYLFLVLLSITFGCSDEGKQSYKPAHTGAPGEVVVVMSEVNWRGEPGKLFRETFQQYYPMLPQAEPQFTLLHFSEEEMSEMLKLHRNIIIVKIGETDEAADNVTVQKNKWSSEQLVFTIRAADTESFKAVFEKNADAIINRLKQKEQDRLRARAKHFGNDRARAAIAEKFGVEIWLPQDAELVVSKPDFSWYKRERVKYVNGTPRQMSEGYIIYTYPYTSDSTFTRSHLLQVRDSVLKANVPGPVEGSYMTTEYRFEPTLEVWPLKDQYAVQMRGLWRTENFMMGGPFISLTTLTANQDSVVTISGYVFAPNFDKREFIREIEAVLSTVKPVSAS